MPDIETITRNLAEKHAEAERLVKNEPSQESLMEEITGRVTQVRRIQIPYLETQSQHFDPMTTPMGPFPKANRYTVQVPGLELSFEGNGWAKDVKKILYVPTGGVCSPVMGGQEIIAKIVNERYVLLPTPYTPKQRGPACGWHDPVTITYVREGRGRDIAETVQAVEIQILDDKDHPIRTDQGRFPKNPHNP